jgi:hypothetical protein
MQSVGTQTDSQENKPAIEEEKNEKKAETMDEVD